MQRTDIRSIEVGLSDPELQCAETFAQRAISVLGYTGYQKALDGQILDRAIQKSNIPALDDNDVARYQKEKIDEVIREKHPRWLKYHRYKPLLLALVFVVLAPLISVFFWLVPNPTVGNTHAGDVLIAAILAALFTVMTSVIVLPKPQQYGWQLRNISGYSGEIPEFAIQQALLIKQLLPAVSIFVEELVEIRDPFIVAVFMGKKRYIAVYDEPKFDLF